MLSGEEKPNGRAPSPILPSEGEESREVARGVDMKESLAGKANKRAKQRGGGEEGNAMAYERGTGEIRGGETSEK